MKEAVAQGVDTRKVVWVGNVACSTKPLLANGGNAVEGAYLWIPFLPLEEAANNPALDAYVSTVGEDKVDTWGITSWQAATAFQQVVDQIVADDGPNAITRLGVLEAPSTPSRLRPPTLADVIVGRVRTLTDVYQPRR